MKDKLEFNVSKICRICGFFKSGVCSITKKKKSKNDKCDVDMGDRSGFIYKEGIITK